MAISIHTREVEKSCPSERGPLAQRGKLEFSSLLKTMSEKKAPSREERIQKAVSDASAKHNLPSNLLLGVIKQESGFNPNAVSSCGAQGCMQLMPETAKDMGVKDSFNIEQNIDGGAKYLRQMLDQFGGDTKLALAAYNSGPGHVQKYGGVPPFAETQSYVKSVMAHTESFGGANLSLSEVPQSSTLDQAILRAERVSAAFAANPLLPTQVHTPKIGNNEEPPPPPPPRGIRV